jgi:hypothetical protein
MRDALGNTRAPVLALLVCLVGGCLTAHKPIDSTQTGNPPVIDSSLLELVVASDTVRITGQPGAVMPADALLKITNLTSGAATQVAVAPDGSFDVQVSGAPDDAFAVQASDGASTSDAVYVTRGSAAVTGGSANSCDQRKQLIMSVLDQAASSAARSCVKDSDCLAVPRAVRCYSLCEYAAVSSLGQQTLATAIETIDAAICAPYTQDGCGSLLASCVEIPPVACSAGQCVTTPSLTCAQREAQAGERLSATVAKLSDLSCISDSDCGFASQTTVCRDTCDSVLTNLAGQAAIAATIADINDGLCAKFAADGCNKTVLSCPPNAGKAVCHIGNCGRDLSAIQQ